MSLRLLALALVSSATLVATQASASSPQIARMFCPTGQGTATLHFQKVEAQTKEGKSLKAVVLEIESIRMVLPAEPLEPIFRNDLDQMNGVILPTGSEGQIRFAADGYGGFGKVLVRITIAMKNPETNKVEAQVLRECQLASGRIGF